MLLILCVGFSMNIMSESFKAKLSKNRSELRLVLGDKKLRSIEMEADRNEIYRITQLLNVSGIGEKTIIKLGIILGTRFDQGNGIRDCWKEK
jgi:hypothetical protein